MVSKNINKFYWSVHGHGNHFQWVSPAKCFHLSKKLFYGTHNRSSEYM